MRGLSRAPLDFKGPVNPLLAIGIVAIGVMLVVKSYRTWIVQQICLLMAIIKNLLFKRLSEQNNPSSQIAGNSARLERRKDFQ